MRRKRRTVLGMGGADYTVSWERVRMGAEELDRWAARITAPHVSKEFATVNLTLRGDWLLRFMPKGPGIENPTTFLIYQRREKAMAHVERWARCHWQRVPVWTHPQRWGAG